jgi:hypothetical protein
MARRPNLRHKRHTMTGARHHAKLQISTCLQWLPSSIETGRGTRPRPPQKLLSLPAMAPALLKRNPFQAVNNVVNGYCSCSQCNSR